MIVLPIQEVTPGSDLRDFSGAYFKKRDQPASEDTQLLQHDVPATAPAPLVDPCFSLLTAPPLYFSGKIPATYHQPRRNLGCS